MFGLHVVLGSVNGSETRGPKIGCLNTQVSGYSELYHFYPLLEEINDSSPIFTVFHFRFNGPKTGLYSLVSRTFQTQKYVSSLRYSSHP